MLIGIISDTHDDMEAIRKAVKVFNSRGVSHVLHAGDFVAPFTFEILSGLRSPLTGIFGNNDGDKLLLNEKSGGRIFNQPYLFELDGKRIALIHEPAVADALAESGRFDIVIYGHSHTPDIREVYDPANNAKKTLVINPGKAARLHKGKSTIAIIDTKRLEAEVIELYPPHRKKEDIAFV